MRILLDVDGVLADFHGGILELIYELFDLRLSIEDFKNWDYTSALEDEEMKRELRYEITKPGFLEALKPYPGSQKAVDGLRGRAEIICVTSPNRTVPTWIPERYGWLEQHFGMPPDEVVLTNRKYLVTGNIMIDDRPKTVKRWAAEYPTKSALLWGRPYNKGTSLPRIFSWNQLFTHAGWPNSA